MVKAEKVKMFYKCPHCDYKVGEQSSLKIHLRTHTGRQPFECDQYDCICDKSGVVRNKRIHSGEKPFKCDLCDYACVTSTQLTKHNNSHTGLFPYKCALCSFKTN